MEEFGDAILGSWLPLINSNFAFIELPFLVRPTTFQNGAQEAL
jgi:hypothetical protein